MWWSGYAFVFISANIYAFFRLRSVCPTPTLKRLLIPFYLLLAAAFPAAEVLSHRAGWGGSKPVLLPGYYALSYILYLVLAVLAVDVLLVLNHFIKAVQEHHIQSRAGRTVRLLVLLGVPLAVVVAGRLNFVHIHVNAYTITVPRHASPLDHLRIVMAADFHLGSLTDRHFMERFLAKANALAPDIVLIPGDIFEGDQPREWTAEIEGQFRRLRTKYGVYACYGNHEAFQAQDLSFFFKNAGIHILRDEIVDVEGLFYVAGRKDGHFRSRAPLARILQGKTADLPVLLMDHRPESFEETERAGVDLSFSGHTHDGQLFPLNWVAAWEYPLSWGHKKIGVTDFFVTCGIQGWGPPIKTAGRSEIMLVDVDLVK